MLYTIKRYRTAFATVTKPKELSSLSSLGLPPMDNLKRKMQLFSCVFDRAVIIMMVAQAQWYKLLLETREPCLGQAAEWSRNHPIDVAIDRMVSPGHATLKA